MYSTILLSRRMRCPRGHLGQTIRLLKNRALVRLRPPHPPERGERQRAPGRAHDGCGGVGAVGWAQDVLHLQIAVGDGRMRAGPEGGGEGGQTTYPSYSLWVNKLQSPVPFAQSTWSATVDGKEAMNATRVNRSTEKKICENADRSRRVARRRDKGQGTGGFLTRPSLKGGAGYLEVVLPQAAARAGPLWLADPLSSPLLSIEPVVTHGG